MKRIHELVLNDGDAQTYNRLGFTYTEGHVNAWLVHPDSQHSEQMVTVTSEQVEEMMDYLSDLKHLMQKAQRGADE